MSNIPGVRITEVDSPGQGAAATSGHVPLLLGCLLGIGYLLWNFL